MTIRFRKIRRDLTTAYARSAMLTAAISMGVIGLGVILGAYSVIKREMKANYMATIPASATLEVFDSIPAEVVDLARSFPGILEAERHATVLARMKVQERWYPLLLFVIDDFKSIRTNKFNHISGEMEPSVGHMLVEQTAFGVMQATQGSKLRIKLANHELTVLLSGTVHDPGLAPAWQEQAGYGYITMSTLRLLLPNAMFDQLRIVVAKQQDSRAHITQTSRVLASRLHDWGIDVHEIQVPPPGKHPHEGQVTTIMTLFVIFSIMVLGLAAILVATTMETVMVKEIRQIGVMKALGAQVSQIAVLYAGSVAALSLVACIIAIPTGWIGAGIFYSMLAGLLNISIHDDTIPAWTVITQLAAGILLPLAAAAGPVLRGSRISVKQALNNFGARPPKHDRPSKTIRLFQAIPVNQLLQLAFRTIFRQRRRLALTVALLAAAGALYLTAKNVSKAWDRNLERVYEQKKYDLDIRFESLPDTAALARALRVASGVRKWEYWALSSTSVETGKGLNISRTYPDKGHGSFTIAGVPIHTELVLPLLVQGHWLKDPTGREVVLNQLAAAQITEPSIGKEISLNVDGNITIWRIVGFTEDVGTPATAYVSIGALLAQSQTSVNSLRIAYADRSREQALANNHVIEQILQASHIPVVSSIPVWVLKNAVAAHMKILVDALLGLALLMAIVGTLALVSAVSISVLERTREIGVMRAIGATPPRIQKLIVWEGVIINALSLVIALPLSMMLSGYLSYLVGALSFRTPLSLTISLPAIAEWTGMLIIAGLLASLVPAQRAAKITIREALSYE